MRLLLPLLMLATVAQSDNPNHSDNSSSTSGEQKYNNYKRERSAQGEGLVGGGVRQLGWAHTKYPASGKRKRKWRIQQSRAEQSRSKRAARGAAAAGGAGIGGGTGAGATRAGNVCRL